jgi:ATP-binding cassette subfamily B protein
MTPGILLVFISYVRSLQKPLRRASRLAGKIGKASACAIRIAEVLEVEPEEKDLPGAVAAPPLKGKIEFQDVHFDYRVAVDPQQLENPPAALNGIQLQIPQGQHLVILGHNGAGKSTLCNLLLRLYEPGQGRILIDDHEVTDWTIRSIRDQISVVLQDSLVLSGSVRDNLLFHNPDASEEQMIAALNEAGCQFLLQHPDKLDRILTEGGRDLSGGERRRLALASALLRDTPIVILDEPTTGIDPETSADLTIRLPRLLKNKTLILITHDELLAGTFDRQIVMEGGTIVEQTGPTGTGGTR